jgi:hypothetical protein
MEKTAGESTPDRAKVVSELSALLGPEAVVTDADSPEEVLYDLTEWPPIERERLDTLLADGGVPHPVP